MVYSFSPWGYEGALVNIEVDLRRGIPAVDIVGLADSEVKASCERVKAGFNNQHIDFPAERVLISLSPADLKKEGAGFDLPIAIAIMVEQFGFDIHKQLFTMGEINLSGCIRPVRAERAGVANALGSGIEYAILPYSENLKLPEGINVAYANNLNEVYYILSRMNDGCFADFNTVLKEKSEAEIEFPEIYEGDTTLDDIAGMQGLKFAMAVAVAGRHNIMAVGSPGCGKTMTLQKMYQLTPKLLPDEKPSVERIYSIAGLEGFPKNGERPFRMPHQTASIEGICGGGVNCRPGEISLAHNGTLFLDEAAEFRSSVLQMLRVPLETHQITLSRAGRTTVYPANFQLAMAVNPCPCGNYGHPDKICLCSAKSVELYWRKFSGPLLDRIDIRFNCNDIDNWATYTEEELKEQIKRAWDTQLKRQGKLNSQLDEADAIRYIELDGFAEYHLARYAEENELSPRAVASIRKVARTVQDMTDWADEVNDISLSIALRLRRKIEPFAL